MTWTNPSISGEAARGSLQGDVPLAKASAAAQSRAERDARELTELEQQLYYPAATPAAGSPPAAASSPASGPATSLRDRLRAFLRH